jgi:hypothetical protein
LAFGAIVVTCHAAHAARVRCEAGIKCLSRTEKQEGPTLVARKCGHNFHMSLRSEVRRHRDTKRQSGLPNLLLALSVSTTSAYSNLGVSQGIEPRTSATNSISLPLSHISCGGDGGRGGQRRRYRCHYCRRQQPTPKPTQPQLDDGGKGGRGETKASSSSSLSCKDNNDSPPKLCQANAQANSTTNGLQGGGMVLCLGV